MPSGKSDLPTRGAFELQAMILNPLGFTGRAMYLTPEFYRSRPVEILVGEGIEADDLHDDCLGTALDALYEYGITELFFHLASYALSVFVNTKKN